MPKVTLTIDDLQQAAIVGLRRNLASLAKGDRYNLSNFSPENAWSTHIEGACGELALCKYLNIYWHAPVNTYKSGYDAGRYQVRTRSKATYQLNIRDDDSSDKLFVLMRGTAPSYELVGWIRGGDAKRPEWKANPGGFREAYFVPDAELHSMETLPKPFELPDLA